ncbi:MAG: peptide chain release factor 1 [Clostridia bacterium]|nr:peptide chain release factor 1 [Clostridia bacterium]
MLDKLKDISKKYDEINEKLSDPEVVTDPEQFKMLMKEQKNLTPIVEKYREYTDAVQTQKDAQEMLETETDKDMRDMLEQEFYEAKDQMAICENELKILLLPKDEDDEKSVIVEIRAGAGGEEAALFAAALYRMYSMYAETKRFKIELMNINETGIGGIKEISFMIEGEGAFSRLKYESGVHRVQRVPDTESSGRIHTSTVTVAVLPTAEDVEIDINPADLEISTFRASGAGGQHVNKTSSAIRIVHIPSGMVVECQDERSQHKNKDKALKVLRSRLYDIERQEQQAKVASKRKSQVGTGDRSERIRTYNYPQGRVTDHRVSLTLYRLEEILNGDIDEIIDVLAAADTAEKLKAGYGE